MTFAARSATGAAPQPTEADPRPLPAFAHASEAELARILDFYEVRWAYEPDTFPIGWAMTGEVIESFAPDFYLFDLDLYVELTTLKQSLVRRKNRKLRRLRELYPDVRIKLFYARDFRALLLKFGRLALLDDLSGTTGQATPPRSQPRNGGEAAGTPAGEPEASERAAAGSRQERLHDGSADGPGGLPTTPRGRRRGRRRRGAAAPVAPTTMAGVTDGRAAASAGPGPDPA